MNVVRAEAPNEGAAKTSTGSKAIHRRLQANKGLRFAISSGAGLVVVFGSVVGGVVGCLVFFWWWPNVTNVPLTAVNLSETLNFAGVMITILAFVSAFYILVVAIDAFKISSDIAENRQFIDDNNSRLDKLEHSLGQEERRLQVLQDQATDLRNEAQLSADILHELNTAEEDTRKMLRRFERTHSALAAICDSLETNDAEDLARAKAYTSMVGDQLSELIDDNEHRRARIVLLASMVSGDLPGLACVEDHHIQALRSEAEGGGPQATRADAVLTKYSVWLAEHDTTEELPGVNE